MDFTIQREHLLTALHLIMGAVDRRQRLPVLSHILLTANENLLTLTATDTEIELKSYCQYQSIRQIGQATVPARKIIEITKALPDNASMRMSLKENRIFVESGNSRFTLATLPTDDFPALAEEVATQEFSIKKQTIRALLEKTHFSMAQQDVRYYLNGMMLIIQQGKLYATATNGHRLATSFAEVNDIAQTLDCKFIAPRRAIGELLHLLADEQDQSVSFALNKQCVRLYTDGFELSSKLIEGEFPDLNRVIPTRGSKQIVCDRDILKSMLHRASIMSHEKSCGIELQLSANLLKVRATNPEQEILEEEVTLGYTGEALDICFNVRYLLDILAVLPEGDVQLSFQDSMSSLVVESLADPQSTYVVMPMRL